MNYLALTEYLFSNHSFAAKSSLGSLSANKKDQNLGLCYKTWFTGSIWLSLRFLNNFYSQKLCL